MKILITLVSFFFNVKTCEMNHNSKVKYEKINKYSRKYYNNAQ